MSTDKGQEQLPSSEVATGNALSERTYQEVEYLKRNLGPILVAALAEICIRRPADPIEYLGHWLLRWRYNEELKRRDVQNALEVVRRKTITITPKDEQPTMINPNAPTVLPDPQTFANGFIPSSPYGPPGYGGPLTGEQLKPSENQQQAQAESVAATDLTIQAAAASEDVGDTAVLTATISKAPAPTEEAISTAEPPSTTPDPATESDQKQRNSLSTSGEVGGTKKNSVGEIPPS